MGRTKGCAYLCDFNGAITGVLRDDFDLTKRNKQGILFTTLIDKDSSVKALDMMMEVKNNNVALDYRLNISYHNTLRSLYFLGVNLDNQLLIIGADNHKEAIEFSNHLHTINNEQANYIRTLLKERINIQAQKDKETEELLDELSNVNNELVNLQRELNKKNIELERLNDIKNRFIGIASHDLRNPLNVVQIYSEFLLDETKDKLSKEHQEFIEVISDSTKFMIGLVNDLLEFSKIESGKIQFNIESFDIIKVVERIVNLMKPIANRKQINIQFFPSVPSLKIEADTFKLEQVINNLLGNAIKFSYVQTEIVLNICSNDNNCEFSVSNYGDGITPEGKDKLFKPFQKIAMNGTNNESGSGLGLFIVKQIIDNHNGEIWFDSIPNGLTTFFFSLPLKSKELTKNKY